LQRCGLLCFRFFGDGQTRALDSVIAELFRNPVECLIDFFPGIFPALHRGREQVHLDRNGVADESGGPDTDQSDFLSEAASLEKLDGYLIYCLGGLGGRADGLVAGELFEVGLLHFQGDGSSPERFLSQVSSLSG